MIDEQIIRHFKQRIDQGTLNHAYIMNGFSTSNINDTVTWILMYYYCKEKRKKDNRPCKKCQNCQEILNKKFVGVTEINTDQQMIKIDQVRDLTNSADYSDLGQKAKFFLIQHSELMNENAQNALLKHLESPSSDRFFFLITRNLSLLLPTIVSRTEVVYFKTDRYDLKQKKDPIIDDFVNLLLKKNPLAYIVLTTKMKPIVKEHDEEFIIYALRNAFYKAKFSSRSIQMLGDLNRNLPPVGYYYDLQRILEKFCLEVLSEDKD